jgi:peptidyl-prolyl cis-trans isomerase C
MILRTGAAARPLAYPLATLILVLAVLGGCSPPSGRVLARVDGQDITQAQFEHAARMAPTGTIDPSPDGKRALLDELVSRTLILGEARRRGYDKGPEIRNVKTSSAEEVLPQVLYTRLISDRVRVTEDEARALWENQGTEWHISQIFTFDERDANNVIGQLKRGMPFADAAMAMSKDRDTGVNGGDLGYLTSGQVPRDMEVAIRKLKPGQWAGPIKTSVGYYIVQVSDVRPRQREPFANIKDGLENMLRQRKERALVLDYVQRLKERRHLHSNPDAYEVLAQKWQDRTTAELYSAMGKSVPDKLGFTPRELAMPLESWDGGSYTLRDFFDEMSQSTSTQKPPINDDPALHLFVGDRAVNRMILDEARTMGLQNDTETELQLRDREDSYLITHVFEEVIVPSSQPTPDELERLRTQMGIAKGDSLAAGRLAQAQEQLFAQKRQAALQALLDRLRREHPPSVNERALAAVPWPVAPKENS